MIAWGTVDRPLGIELLSYATSCGWHHTFHILASYLCAEYQSRSPCRLQTRAKARALVTREGTAVVQGCFGRRTRRAEDSARRPSNSGGALRTRFAKPQQPLLQSLSHLVS